MKYQLALVAAASLAQYVSAFPAMDIAAHMKRQEQGENISGNNVPDPAQVRGLFDPARQFVSNSGDHRFIAPGPTDARGPCPGLNAMANHGYIRRDGVGTLREFVAGTGAVFGMSRDLAGFLSLYASAINGNGQLWSIGGRHPATTPANGLTGSHNNYECDASPTRGDLYQFGNNFEVRWQQWEQLLAMQEGISNAESNFNLQVLQEFRSARFDQSVNENPYFFNGPFSGVAVQPAAYTFIYRFMGNKSAEHPEGQLTREVLSAFFGATDNGDGTWSGGAGFERIPDNWYKRHPEAEYSIPFFIQDLLQEASVYPKFISIGGNLGEPNTFTGVNLGDLSGGFVNAGNVLQGNNLFCLAYQFAAQARPDFLTALLTTLTGEAGRAILALGCPQLAAIDESLLEQFPGYARSNS